MARRRRACRGGRHRRRDASAWHGRTRPAVLAVASASKVLIVGSGPGSTLSSIGSALAQAAVGDTIVVEPGEYREEVAVTKAITLTSREPRAAIIHAPSGALAAVLVEVDELARVIGFTIDKGNTAIRSRSVYRRARQAEVEDMDVSGASRAGIEISSTDAVVVRAVRLRGNASSIRVRDNATPRLVHNVLERRPGADRSRSTSSRRRVRWSRATCSSATMRRRSTATSPSRQRARSRQHHDRRRHPVPEALVLLAKQKMRRVGRRQQDAIAQQESRASPLMRFCGVLRKTPFVDATSTTKT